MTVLINPLKDEIISTFGTPCAVIDLDIVDSNIERAQSLCDSEGVANRPHIKTHKSPVLAKSRLQPVQKASPVRNWVKPP